MMRQSLYCLFDIGNTRCKWAMTYAGDHAPIRLTDSLPTLELADGEALACQLRSLPVPDHVAVANVAGAAVAETLLNILKLIWPDVDIQFIRSEASCCGVVSGYLKPETLGVDRWLGLLAARSLYRHRPVCLASLGSALTIDFMDADGMHLGGTIAPGLGLQLQALSSLLGVAVSSGQAVVSWYGRDTQQAGTSGALLLLASAVHMARSQYPDACLLLTGGDAPALLPYLGEHLAYHESLVFEGMRCWLLARGI